ncbi:unnamed protein product, partial [Rangifer tarandus platyrhynchus]
SFLLWAKHWCLYIYVNSFNHPMLRYPIRLLLSGVHTRPEESKFGCSWPQPGKAMWVKDNQPAKKA